MDTDGGSIPGILHGNMKYSPWGYGLGYIIHDWLFVAHKCEYQPGDDVIFADSARVLGEAIKTLMETGFTDFDGKTVRFPRSESAAWNIYAAVQTKIARKLRDKKGSVFCRN